MLVVSGALLMEHPNSAAIMDRVRNLTEKLGERLLRPTWKGLCFPVRGASHVGAMQLGWRKPAAAHGSDLEAKRVLLMIGSADTILNEHSNPRSDQFRIYLGHHADRGALTAAVALPTAAYTEKTGTFINLEGRVQRTRAAATPPGDAKEEWETLRALGEFSGAYFTYDTIEELRAQRLPWAVGSVLASSSSELLQMKGSTTNVRLPSAHTAPFSVVNLPDYYMTDVISRASPTMAKCSIAFSGKVARSTAEVDRLYRQAAAISE
jgi:NADH dehydrogenase (ubiquinone) Fe-S protein 1